MTILLVDDFSVAVMGFFMKLIGVWFAANSCERWLRNVAFCYTMWLLLLAVWIQSMIIYHSSDDFEYCLYGLLNFLSTTVPMFKILIVLSHKKEFFDLIQYMVRNFLHANYDDYETSVLMNCKRKCNFFVGTLVCFTEVTVFTYVVSPLIVNLGKNESERVLPFKLWINLPIQETPYFEIAYVAEALSSYSVGFAYCSIDNVLCVINLHLAGQFKILQYRLSQKYARQDQSKLGEKSKNSVYLENSASAVFKSCIRQHQALIAYCEQLEEVFGLVVLVQVLAFSIFICLDGYQVLLAELVQRKVMLLFHLLATVCQLVMFSYSCDCIIHESTKLATAAYSGPWLRLPVNKSVRHLKKDLIMLIKRSNIPCCITGSGFFIVSLETCTRVLTTAGSYFTLLQKTQDSINS